MAAQSKNRLGGGCPSGFVGREIGLRIGEQKTDNQENQKTGKSRKKKTTQAARAGEGPPQGAPPLCDERKRTT